MIDIQCVACGKRHSIKDDLAGKKAKCGCGALIKIPFPAAAVPAPVPQILPLMCPHCQASIQAQWKGCPACGGPLTPSQVAPAAVPLPVQQVHSGYAQAIPPMPGPSGIQVGNESVAKINVNNSVNVTGVPGMSGAMMGMPGQVRAEGIPYMQVGDGSVVKAEIDSSMNYTNQGQIIGQQNIENKVVTNITKNETTTGFFLSALIDHWRNSASESKHEAKIIENELRSLSSAQSLREFVARQTAFIQATTKASPSVQRNSISARFSAGKQALETLSSMWAGNAFESAKIQQLRTDLDQSFKDASGRLTASYILKGLKYFAYFYAIIFVIGLCFSPVAFYLIYKKEADEQDLAKQVNELINRQQFHQAKILIKTSGHFISPSIKSDLLLHIHEMELKSIYEDRKKQQ
jgi:hypothetical protein